jgi:hypothetical protein
MMQIVIAFYRTRPADDARAIVGRESAVAADLAGAIGLARRLSRTLEMPQQPDAMSVTDSRGRVLYSGAIEAAGSTG